jgi:phenylpropionate dioxygenase-like ring-hydroxylating dioxygenase large terminal subunit
MLKAEDNEILCRVGPGTAMGELMRQYWIPAARAEELPSPDCAPLRVRLLCEDLIAFRLSSGNIGLVANACPHRGASLFFGRNEEEGIRCVYHGWKFDAAGVCTDMPSEPAESNFKSKVRVKAYPCIERNGIIWTYMGPRETPPPLPDLEPNMLPEGQYSIESLMRDCNWMQALEGDIDSVHVMFLHRRGNQTLDDVTPGTISYYMLREMAGRYSVIEDDYGTSYGTYRSAEEDTYYWRIAHFLMPFYTMTPTGQLGQRKAVRAWVPMDDYHTLYFVMSDNVYVRAVRTEVLPNTTGTYGRYRPAANYANDYNIDREAQRSKLSFSGLPDITIQDQAIIETMDPIVNRPGEHAGTSDSMIIRTRRVLVDAAKAFRDHGTLPRGVDDPTVYRQRSGDVILPRSADVWEATKDLRTAFVEHAELASLPRG